MLYPQVSVIIPSFNEGTWLERTVRSCLEKTDYPDFEIIVVGDNCNDGSVEALQAKHFPNVKIINLPISQGAIVTRNQGVGLAQGEILVFIDSHQEPITDNWLKVLVNLLQKPNCGAATINIAPLGEVDRLGFLYTLKNWTLEPTWEYPKTSTIEIEAPAVPGGCFAIKKNLFFKTGGFNSHLKKWGREDFEYSLRLWRQGYDLWFSSEAIMGHAFDHHRAFEVSWEQVDFNTLWTVYTLFDKESIALVEAEIKQARPQVFKKIKLKITTEISKEPPKQLSLVRSFSDYRKKFIRL